MVANGLTQKKNELSGMKGFNNLIQSNLMKQKICEMVGNTNAQEFITSITSAVNTNPALAECDSQSIISAALLGQSLHLKPSPQLGYFYLVPFKNKKEGNIKAQFQLGYKGYLQLAIRTGEYIDIDAMEIRKGEYKGRNRMTGKPEFEFVDDDELRESLPIVGYMAYFEMKNGYIKRLYWSKEKMMNHADKYSQAFSAKTLAAIQEGKIDSGDLWKYSSFWYKNFDEMAKKTMLRQLLSKHGLLSTDMQKAVVSDQAVIREDMTPDFIENELEQPKKVETVEEDPVIARVVAEHKEKEMAQQAQSFDFDPMKD